MNFQSSRIVANVLCPLTWMWILWSNWCVRWCRTLPHTIRPRAIASQRSTSTAKVRRQLNRRLQLTQRIVLVSFYPLFIPSVVNLHESGAKYNWMLLTSHLIYSWSGRKVKNEIRPEKISNIFHTNQWIVSEFVLCHSRHRGSGETIAHELPFDDVVMPTTRLKARVFFLVVSL